MTFSRFLDCQRIKGIRLADKLLIFDSHNPETVLEQTAARDRDADRASRRGYRRRVRWGSTYRYIELAIHRISEVGSMATIRAASPKDQPNHQYPQMIANAVAVTGGEVTNAGADRQDLISPITGCLSAISSCDPLGHDYTDALKSYAESYAAFQAYLEPDNVLSQHDYDLAIALSMPELPWIEDDLLGFVAPTDIPVTEEEIEHCGYMAWLRH